MHYKSLNHAAHQISSKAEKFTSHKNIQNVNKTDEKSVRVQQQPVIYCCTAASDYAMP